MRWLLIVVSVFSVVSCSCATSKKASRDVEESSAFEVSFIDGPPESGLEICIFPEAGAEVKCIKYETFLAAQKQRASENPTDL